MNKPEYIEKLLIWHSKNYKRYIWRKTNDPYSILIAEILLQRTDAKKIEKIYPRFIKRYPTIEHLYNSTQYELDELIGTIGLRYKSKRLLRISKEIVDKFCGIVPNQKSDLMSLYGVGEYISNAVLCFAYKMKVPIVDANVIRIYYRIFGIKSLKSRPHTDKFIWNFAETILPNSNYIEYNYAILDFASSVCKPRNPFCGTCPLRNLCEINLRGGLSITNSKRIYSSKDSEPK